MTGKLDAFEWKVPVEQLAGPSFDNQPPAQAFDRAMASLPPIRETAASAPELTSAFESSTPIADPLVEAVASAENTSETPRPAGAGKPAAVIDAEVVSGTAPVAASTNGSGTASAGDSESAAKGAPTAAQGEPDAAKEATALEAAAEDAAAKPDTKPEIEQTEADPEAEARAKEESFLTHRPDDPGIDVNAEPEKPGRFRLF